MFPVLSVRDEAITENKHNTYLVAISGVEVNRASKRHCINSTVGATEHPADHNELLKLELLRAWELSDSSSFD